MELFDFISLLAIYLEIAVLAFFEYKMWRTMYTPLNLLMLPYALVLFLTILMSGNWGIAEFYYPSLIVWMVGLLIFAAPSYLLAIVMRDKIKKWETCSINDNMSMKYLNIFTSILLLLFLYRFFVVYSMRRFMIGTEDFGELFCQGIWGHLHRLLHVLLILYVYKYDKKHRYYLIFIFGILFVTFMYGVKSWILIPLMGGLCMRLYTGKMKLHLSLIIKVLVLGFLVFFVSYFLSLFIAKEGNAKIEVVLKFIVDIFVHYFVSGVLGWSQDLQMGILEHPNFDSLMINILNIVSLVTGDEFIDAINPVFIHNGIKGSNVRTFFGTIYINSNLFQFVLMTLVFSFISYLSKIWAIVSKSVYVNTMYFFFMGLLFMGWFEIYYYHLVMIEVPMWIMIIWLLLPNKKQDLFEAK